MSLVGSLEDLALGDILQIVSLSRKSGLLLLHSHEGDGRIFFRDGLVQAATVKGAPEDLAALLVAGGFVGQAELDLAVEAARSEGRPEVETVLACADLSEERSVDLLRDHVKQCVLRMFDWRVGEFSFEVRDHMDQRDSVLALPVGINAQFLTIEASRLGDETGEESEDPADGFLLSGEADGGGPVAPAAAAAPEAPASGAAYEAPLRASAPEAPAARPAPEAPPRAPARDAPAAGPANEAAAVGRAQEAPGAGPTREAPAAVPAPEAPAGRPAGESEAAAARQALGVATAARSVPEPGPAPPPAASGRAAAAPAAGGATPAASPARRLPLVVIDPELPALEWAKSQLDGIFARIHIFQHSEGGIARIRQYLSRAELPVVLVSTAVPADSLTGATDVTDLLGRLRAQAPRMTIVAMHEEGRELPPGVDAADGLVTRPSAAKLTDDRNRDEIRAASADLVATLRPWAGPSGGRVVAPPPAPKRRSMRAQTTAAALRALEKVSDRLRDPATRGEVLNLVLDFAARRFRRVAMFMVTDDEAVGIAQRGLAEAGGPSDEAFRTLCVPLHDPAWFRSVAETGESLKAGPSDEGDRRLAARLGSRAASEAFVAPIESGGRVAALLYADDLPETGPLGDTTAVSIVLHEAGLALDRALLERALAQAER